MKWEVVRSIWNQRFLNLLGIWHCEMNWIKTDLTWNQLGTQEFTNHKFMFLLTIHHLSNLSCMYQKVSFHAFQISKNRIWLLITNFFLRHVHVDGVQVESTNLQPCLQPITKKARENFVQFRKNNLKNVFSSR